MPHNEDDVCGEGTTPDAEPVVITGFPFISSAEFQLAAVSLIEAFKQDGHRQHDWESVRLVESVGRGVRILKDPL